MNQSSPIVRVVKHHRARISKILCTNLIKNPLDPQPCGRNAAYLIFPDDPNRYAALPLCNQCFKSLTSKHHFANRMFLATVEHARIETSAGCINIDRLGSNRKRKRGIDFRLKMNDQESKSLNAWIRSILDRAAVEEWGSEC